MQNSKQRTSINIKADKIVNGRPMRTCPTCRIMKDLDDFGLRFMQRKDGSQECRVQARCHKCR